MKSILIIGMGRFGRHLCMNLSKRGNQIMIVDVKEENLEGMLPYVVSAKIGDCTNEEVLKSLGISNFDVCFVCIGTNFQSSLEITSLIKEMGARHVVSKATRDIHAKFLLRNGADEVIYPDRDVAERLAVRFSANHVFDYIELADGYAIYEILPLDEWLNKTLIELDMRNRYHINVIGMKENGKVALMPAATHRIQPNEHLIIVGRQDDVGILLKRL
ncbi:potassium transporter TrkA [Lachnoclostridium sp. An14]|uniref:potassium channel family protein n=1 Tax=Lachnoclostridium sp. An14 TaxID=1965562 RepID=UPI000B3AF0CA|nr:TrkA family potassium uptake protein [Lachnoclostridium sp. An14]OUQ21483.1 potassium transporter TrkA [Lachnoclostridium sp. An14]